MHTEIINFVKNAGKLKLIDRKGWVSWVNIKNPETVADHSFRMAILTMCLSDLKGLNTEKLMRMTLLHDMHEALIGDYDYFDKQQINKNQLKEIEVKAINEVFHSLPQQLREEYTALALEYLLQESKEAKFLRQIDQLEMMMQALEYEKQGYSKQKLQAFWDNIEEKLQDPDVKEIFAQLKKERA